jgi:hypothetical protein
MQQTSGAGNVVCNDALHYGSVLRSDLLGIDAVAYRLEYKRFVMIASVRSGYIPKCMALI